MCQAKVLGPIIAALLCGAQPSDAGAQTSASPSQPAKQAGEVVGQSGSKSGQRVGGDPTTKRQAVPRLSTPPPPQSTAEAEQAARANQWTVGLAAGLPEGLFLRFGAEIARNLNDAEPLRVLPMVTPGATGNVKDLLYLRGVDVAITHSDVLEHFKKQEPASVGRKL